MSVEGSQAPATPEVATPAAPEPSLPADFPVHPGNAGLPRDPATGKFLPRDAAQKAAPEKTPAPASSKGRTDGSEPSDGGSTPSAGTQQPVDANVKTEPLSDRFAILAKKERALVQRDQELKARLADIEKREAALKSGVVPTQKFKEKPLQALAEQMGISIKEAYDIVTQQALNGFEDPATPAEQAARLAREEVEKIRAELKAEREAELARAKEQAKAEEARVLESFRQECNSELARQKEKYELASHFATGDDVYQLVTSHWALQVQELNAGKRKPEQMRALTIDEALQMMEEHFEKQVEAGLKLKKVSAKVQPAPTPAPQRPTPPSDQPRALSNRLASTAATEGEAPPPWDREARLKRAIAAGEANRKK